MGLLTKLGLPPVPAKKPVPPSGAATPKSGGATGAPAKPANAAPVLGSARADAAAAAAEKSYRDAFAAMQGDHDAASETRLLFANAANAATLKRWDDAEKARTDAEARKDWVAASGALSVLKIAARELAKARTDKEAYDAALAPVVQDWKAAEPYQEIEILARFKVAMHAAWKPVGAAADAKNWALATSLLPPVSQAAKKLAAEGKLYEDARKPFDAEFAKVANLDAAKAVLAAPPKAVAKQAESFRNRFAAVNDARNAGDFAAATKGLPLLKAAVAELLTAKEADDTRRQAFQTAFATVPQHALLVSLAAAPPPALAPKAGPFLAADKAVKAACDLGDWAAAKAAVPALKAAAEALVAAKETFNTQMTPEAAEAFDKKIAALKPRTDKALDSPVPAFVVPLQKAVMLRVSGIQELVSAADHAGAELGHSKLLVELDAMEKAKKDFAAWQAAHKAVKEGEIAKSLAVDLKVAGLIAARKKAIDKGEASIKAAADKGNFGAAQTKTKAWVAEAKAWAGAKDAYDSLHSGGTPEEAKLKSLADKDGGGEVLDALVADLPDNATQKVLAVALKARFGFGVKRFGTANDDKANTAGLTPLSPNLPDKSLKKVYEVLGKVPPAKLKGKITELVDYDSNDGGAMYDKKKIYMYCGRPDDADAGKQEFEKEGEVVPKGEHVEEACKPTNPDPLPYFDFALLHEAGHAEDDAAGSDGFMGSRQNNPEFGGWVVHGGPETVAEVAAKHFGYDKGYVLATLKAKGSVPPAKAPAAPKGVDAAAWDQSRERALAWCQSVRVDIGLWWKGGLSKQMAIGGRVYHEAYENYWVSYLLSARSRGITGYQFRSHWEWFAELYAAYFSKKLKPNHPSAKWLKDFKGPKG